MKRLWAPWRMTYLHGPAPPKGCLFCRVWKEEGGKGDFVLERREHALLMLNRFPYNAGHVMVAVGRHAARFDALTAAERTEVLDLVALAERALQSVYRPDGINYGANIGKVAGAGFPGHLHLHLVPRWNGDTNFMPIVGETKVIPESLARTWTRLRAGIAEVRAGARKRGGRRR